MHFLLFTEASQLQKKCSSGKGKPQGITFPFHEKIFPSFIQRYIRFHSPENSPTPNPSHRIDGEPDALKWNFMAKYQQRDRRETLATDSTRNCRRESEGKLLMPSHSEKALWKRLRKPKMLMKIIKLGSPKATEREEKTPPSSASSKTFNLKFKLKILSQQQLLIRS